MSAQNSAGIQTLLDLENVRDKTPAPSPTWSVVRITLTWSNTVRTKKVKEARDEARKEIEEYRAKKEAEYREFEAEHTQGNKQAEEEANKEADAKIREIKEAGKKSQEKVIQDLLKAVFDVTPLPPSEA